MGLKPNYPSVFCIISLPFFDGLISSAYKYTQVSLFQNIP